MSGRRWIVDPAASRVGFRVHHLGVATVRGRFADLEGEFTMPGARTGRGSAQGSVGTASVRTGDARRDAFLPSADFLDAERHPRIAFSAVAVRDAGHELIIEGELEIRGIGHPVTLRAERADDARDPDLLHLRVTGAVDRHAWGLRFTQGFGTSDRTVSGTVELELDLELRPAD